MNQMPYTLSAKVTAGLPRRRFTVAEIEEMTERGVFLEDERFELIAGEIIPMSPKGNWHENLKQELLEWLYTRRTKRLKIIPETTFRLSEDTFIEPDVLVYPVEVPLASISGNNILLAIELADTSLSWDLKRKPLIYAHFGVCELWVVDARRRKTTVFRNPGPEGYGDISTHAAEALLTPLNAPELAISLAALR
ncbi:MAG: Uma2 family endonuclease [Beijerinckiaceae bacterium]